jgi:micrococcal nuclease
MDFKLQYKLDNLYKYRAIILNVVDGDTFDASVDLGFGIMMNQRFRVADFDAPESWRPKTENEKIHGNQAKQRAIDLLLNQQVFLETSKVAGIYGRYSAKVYLSDGSDFATVMINEGLSKRDSY